MLERRGQRSQTAKNYSPFHDYFINIIHYPQYLSRRRGEENCNSCLPALNQEDKAGIIQQNEKDVFPFLPTDSQPRR